MLCLKMRQTEKQKDNHILTSTSPKYLHGLVKDCKLIVQNKMFSNLDYQSPKSQFSNHFHFCALVTFHTNGILRLSIQKGPQRLPSDPANQAEEITGTSWVSIIHISVESVLDSISCIGMLYFSFIFLSLLRCCTQKFLIYNPTHLLDQHRVSISCLLSARKYLKMLLCSA